MEYGPDSEWVPTRSHSSGVSDSSSARLAARTARVTATCLADGTVVVQPLGPLRFAVPGQLGVVIGDDAADPGIGHRLGVGEVMDNLAGRPSAVWRDAVELVVGDADEGVVHGVASGAVALEQRGSIGHRSSVHGS